MFKLICRVPELLLKIVLLDLSELAVLDFEVPHELILSLPLLFLLLLTDKSLSYLVEHSPFFFSLFSVFLASCFIPELILLDDVS